MHAFARRPAGRSFSRLGRRRRAGACLAAAALALTPPLARAADTWDDSSGDGLWSSGPNWVDNTVPGSGDIVTFPAGFPGPGAKTTVTLSSGELAASLIFNDSYTLSPGSLQLSDSGSAQVISGRTARIFSALSGFSNFSKVGAPNPNDCLPNCWSEPAAASLLLHSS